MLHYCKDIVFETDPLKSCYSYINTYTMKNENYDPKDDQITNDDDAVTNKDGDNNLEKGEQPTDESKTEATDIPTVTPSNDGDPGLGAPPVVKGEQSPVEKGEQSTSNKGQGPAGENL
jgi:hypothetical protein